MGTSVRRDASAAQKALATHSTTQITRPSAQHTTPLQRAKKLIQLSKTPISSAITTHIHNGTQSQRRSMKSQPEDHTTHLTTQSSTTPKLTLIPTTITSNLKKSHSPSTPLLDDTYRRVT